MQEGVCKKFGWCAWGVQKGFFDPGQIMDIRFLNIFDSEQIFKIRCLICFDFEKSKNPICSKSLLETSPWDHAPVKEFKILFQIALTRVLYDQMTP